MQKGTAWSRMAAAWPLADSCWEPSSPFSVLSATAAGFTKGPSSCVPAANLRPGLLSVHKCAPGTDRCPADTDGALRTQGTVTPRDGAGFPRSFRSSSLPLPGPSPGAQPFSRFWKVVEGSGRSLNPPSGTCPGQTLRTQGWSQGRRQRAGHILQEHRTPTPPHTQRRRTWGRPRRGLRFHGSDKAHR